MAGRGTPVVPVEVEDQLLARMVFHLPVTADLLPSRAVISFTVEVMVLLNKCGIFFPSWETMYLRAQGKMSINLFLWDRYRFCINTW